MDYLSILAAIISLLTFSADSAEPVGACRDMSVGGRAIYAMSQMLWATDRLQSRDWVAYTPDNPFRTASGAVMWEGNPLLAGRPEVFPEYVHVALLIERRILECLPDQYALPLVGAFLVKQALDIHSNNAARVKYLGEAPLIAVGWSWTF